MGQRIGREAYSYRFVFDAFAPLLGRWGRTIEVTQAESRLDYALWRARQQHLEPVHLSFLPLHLTYLTHRAPNVAFPFWEFPDLPNRAFDNNPRNNWVHVADHLDLIVTASRFTRDAFVRAGVRTPIKVVPVPIAAEYFSTPAWQPGQRTVIESPCYVFPQLEKSTVGAMRGDLGYAHMVVLARTADATGEAFNERDLLEKALENSPGKLHYLCRHYRHARNPKAHAEEEADLHEQRFLKVGTCPNGGMSVSGFLDPVGGEALRSALEPLARKDGADDERDRAQRMADALLEAVTGGGIKANIQVTATVETLATRLHPLSSPAEGAA